MKDITDHPQGEYCIAALYAAFDPECEDVGFMTIPWHEDEGVAVWYFTGDTGGTEHEPGVSLVSGFAGVQKSIPMVCIYTLFPMQTFSIINIFDGEVTSD